MDDLLDFFVLQEVVLEGGGDVHKSHAGLDAVLEVHVFVQILGRPEIHQLDGFIHTTDTVNATETLNDADGIPVDVVIDQIIAILKVLPLTNAVGGDEEVNFTLLGHGGNLVSVLGTRGKVGKDLVEIRFSESGVISPGTGNERDMDAKLVMRPRPQGIEQICRSIGKRREDEDLLIWLAVLVRGGIFDFVLDELFQLLELCITLGSDSFG